MPVDNLVNLKNKISTIKMSDTDFFERLGFFDTIFAILISAMIYVFAFSIGNFRWLVVTQGIFVFWVFLANLLTYRQVKFSSNDLYVMFAFSIVLLSNLIVNFQNIQIVSSSINFAAMHVLGVLAFIFAANWATRKLRPENILTMISLLMVPIMIFAIAHGETLPGDDRGRPLGLSPSWWGEVAFGFILCSLVLKKQSVRFLFISAGIILIILVESRGSLLAAIVSIFFYYVLHDKILRFKNIDKLVFIGVIIIVCFLLLLVFGGGGALVDLIISKILVLDSPGRGIGSHFSKRVEGWEEAITTFLNHPLFGQGFDTLLDVHSGYLRWAGEGGVLLLGLMLIVIGNALIKSRRYKNDWAFSSLVGILVYFLTFPRSLNLNIVGFLFLLSLFPWPSNSDQTKNTAFKGNVTVN